MADKTSAKGALKMSAKDLHDMAAKRKGAPKQAINVGDLMCRK